jgi:hypothetical protein
VNYATWLPPAVAAKAVAIAAIHCVSRGTVIRRFIVEGIAAYEAEHGPVLVEAVRPDPPVTPDPPDSAPAAHELEDAAG